MVLAESTARKFAFSDGGCEAHATVVADLVMGGQAMPLPVFFPSVSSVKANLLPSEYIRLLAAAAVPCFLVSAYDIATPDGHERAAIRRALSDAMGSGVRVLLDSGNYESFWRADPRWTATELATVLASTSAPLAFCYDNQSPPAGAEMAAEEVVAAVGRDQPAAPGTTVCPIVHGTLEQLPAVVRTVAERLQPLVVAVAERELGDGVLARSRTIRHLRSTLNEVASGTALHVLGTGSPIAILIYAMAGAQSFDGLEWCHTCVDPDSVRLHHFQHRDLVRTLEPSIVSTLPYAEGTLIHNLFFYRAWLARIRDALAVGTADELLGSVLPPSRCNEVLDGLRYL